MQQWNFHDFFDRAEISWVIYSFPTFSDWRAVRDQVDPLSAPLFHGNNFVFPSNRGLWGSAGCLALWSVSFRYFMRYHGLNWFCIVSEILIVFKLSWNWGYPINSICRYLCKLVLNVIFCPSTKFSSFKILHYSWSSTSEIFHFFLSFLTLGCLLGVFLDLQKLRLIWSTHEYNL